jgi:hypothetical protein
MVKASHSRRELGSTSTGGPTGIITTIEEVAREDGEISVGMK